MGRIPFLSTCTLLLVGCLVTAVAQTRQEVHEFADPALTRPVQYLISLPFDYDLNRKAPWTAVFFFHGSGERGIDIRQVLRNGPPLRIEQGAPYPAVVISPQCSGRWWDSEEIEMFIEAMTKAWNLSRSDLRLTGLSMGGFAVWDLAVRHPERYSRILPICGAGDPTQAYRLKNLDVWAVHGALDETVSARGTTDMVAALRAAGGQPRLTLYPDLGHESWTRTYEDPEVEQWLFTRSPQ